MQSIAVVDIDYVGRYYILQGAAERALFQKAFSEGFTPRLIELIPLYDDPDELCQYFEEDVANSQRE